MMKKPVLWIVIAITCLLILSACGDGPSESPAQRPIPPPEYQEFMNPMDGVQASADAGKEIFNINCASCHGDTGQGDGPIGPSLDPEPGNLAESQKKLSDAYLYWRIADGGIMEPFNSAMPFWKSVFSDDQIWELITYIRTLGE